MTDEARLERVKRALTNPIYFAEAYVRPFDPNWVDPLPPFASDLMRFCLTHRRGVVMMPPEFLKTTLISQVLPLWLTVRSVMLGTQLRGLMCSEEEGMAKGNLGVVAWHIDNNHLIARDFCDEEGNPLIYPDPGERVWRGDAITVVRNGASKDPTWQAKGLDSKGIQGRRLDWLIGDDLITPKNAESPALRKRALDYWDLQFETRLVGSGRGLMCGNFNDARDLLSTLAARENYGLFRRPSFHKPDAPNEAPTEAEMQDPARSIPLWPQVWPRERLLAEKKAKPNRFRRIHLLDPRAESGERLKAEWMQVIDPIMTPTRYCKFYMSFDAAPGGTDPTSEDLDFFNITVVAEHEGNLDLVESISVRADVPRQVALIGSVHDRWQRMGRGVVAIGSAKVAMDRYMRGSILISRPDLKNKLKEVSVPGAKEERIDALGPYAQSGWVRCWHTCWDHRTSDFVDQHQELTFSEEWRDFPFGTHDDRLDGLDVAIRTVELHGGGQDVEYDVLVAEP